MISTFICETSFLYNYYHNDYLFFIGNVWSTNLDFLELFSKQLKTQHCTILRLEIVHQTTTPLKWTKGAGLRSGPHSVRSCVSLHALPESHQKCAFCVVHRSKFSRYREVEVDSLFREFSLNNDSNLNYEFTTL